MRSSIILAMYGRNSQAERTLNQLRSSFPPIKEPLSSPDSVRPSAVSALAHLHAILVAATQSSNQQANVEADVRRSASVARPDQVVAPTLASQLSALLHEFCSSAGVAGSASQGAGTQAPAAGVSAPQRSVDGNRAAQEAVLRLLQRHSMLRGAQLQRLRATGADPCLLSFCWCHNCCSSVPLPMFRPQSEFVLEMCGNGSLR